MDTQNPSAPSRAQSRFAGKNHPTGTRHSGGVDPRQHPPHHPLHGDRQPPRPAPGAVAPGDRTGRPHPVAAQRRPRRHQDPHRPLPRGRDPYRRRPARTGDPRLPAPRPRTHPRRPHRHPHGLLQPARPHRRQDEPDAGTSRRRPARRRKKQGTPQAAPRRTPARLHLPRPPPDRHRPPRRPAPHGPPPAPLRLDTAHLAPGVAAWLERDVTPTAVRARPDQRPPAEPCTARPPSWPTASRPSCPPAALPGPGRHRHPSTRDAELRRLRPRLPGPEGSRCRDCGPTTPCRASMEAT